MAVAAAKPYFGPFAPPIYGGDYYDGGYGDNGYGGYGRSANAKPQARAAHELTERGYLRRFHPFASPFMPIAAPFVGYPYRHGQ